MMKLTDSMLWKAAKKQVGLTVAKEKAHSKQFVNNILYAPKPSHKQKLLSQLRAREEYMRGPVPIFDLKYDLQKKGLSPSKTQKIINELKIKGTIFEPRTGYLMRL